MNASATALMDLYASEVMKHRVLPKEEELALARLYVAGDARAGQRLVTVNLRYAMSVAHEFRYWGHPLEDLVQEANTGMVMALRKFNPDRGFRFVSYATWWIRAYLRNYLIHNAAVVRFGTTSRERRVFGKLSAVLARFQRENPNLDEAGLYTLAAEELAVDREELRVMHGRTRAGSTQSLNQPLSQQNGGGDEATFQDLVEDPRPSQLDQVSDQQTRERVRAACRAAARNPRERYIVEKRLLSDDPLTLEELGQRLNSRVNGERLSRERVRQIEAGIRRRTGDLLRATP